MNKSRRNDQFRRYLQATVEYALRHAEVGPEFAIWLRNLNLAP